MGKATILANLGEGLYKVQQDRGQEKINARITKLQAQLTKVEQQIVTVLNKRSQLDSQLIQARLNFQLATDEYVAAVAGDPKASTTGWETAQKELLQLQAQYEESTRELEKLRANKTSTAKEITSLQSLNLVSTFDAWCADYKDDATGTVATIEIPGEPQRTLIAPQAPAWTSAAGEVLAREAMTGPQAFFNAAILPGWQKFKPTYRRGVITAVDQTNSKANVTLLADPSSAQGLGINQSNELIDVPIVYDCGASSFNIGDECVVQFLNQNWSNPQIIGFMSNPVGCGGAVFKSFPDFQFPVVYYNASYRPFFDVDSSGNIYTCEAVYERTTSYNGYLSVIKFNKNGQILFVKRLNHNIPNFTPSDYVFYPARIIVRDTGIYIGLNVNYRAVYTTNTINIMGPAIIKLDNNGNFVWGRDIVSLYGSSEFTPNPQGSTVNIKLTSFDVNELGEVVMATEIDGQVLNTYEVVPTGGSSYRIDKTLINFANFGKSMAVFKLNSSGGLATSTYFSDGTSFARFQLRWIGMVNNSSQDSWLVVKGPDYQKMPNSIKFGENGNIYIAGTETRAESMGQAVPPGGAFFEIPGIGHEGSIPSDVPRESNLFFVMKMNPSASAVIWTKAYSGDEVPNNSPDTTYTGIGPEYYFPLNLGNSCTLEVDLFNSKVYALGYWNNSYNSAITTREKIKNVLFTLDFNGTELSRKAYKSNYSSSTLQNPIWLRSDQNNLYLYYYNANAKLSKSDYTLYPSLADAYQDNRSATAIQAMDYGADSITKNGNNYYMFYNMNIKYQGSNLVARMGLLRVKYNNNKPQILTDSMDTKIITLRSDNPVYPFMFFNETNLSSINNSTLRANGFTQYFGIESRSISFTALDDEQPLIEVAVK